MTSQSLKKGILRWVKAFFLFIGRSILFCLGISYLTFFFTNFFELNFSATELSIAEMLFIVVIFVFTRRYISRSKSAGLRWTSMIYRPIRNLGWLGFGVLMILIYLVIDGVDLMSPEFYYTEYANVEQLIDLGAILICFYWATPKSPSTAPAFDAAINTGTK